MATVAELKAAKKAGAAAFRSGEVPKYHPSQCGGELYEAWYDGWDQAQTAALENEDFED
jgi:hypothetical protein